MGEGGLTRAHHGAGVPNPLLRTGTGTYHPGIRIHKVERTEVDWFMPAGRVGFVKCANLCEPVLSTFQINNCTINFI